MTSGWSAWHAELIRVVTVRGLWWGAVLSALAAPLFSLLVVSTGGLGAHDTLTSGATTGTMVGLLGFGAWAAACTSGDHAHGTITLSLALVPRRRTLYAARLGALSGVAGVVAALAAAVSLLVVVAASPAGSHPLGHPLHLAAAVPAYAVVAAVGAALGVVLRSTTSAILVTAAALLLPQAAGTLLGGLQRWVVGASPATVVSRFAGNVRLPADESFPGGEWAALAAMLVVAAVVVVATGIVFARRDA